MDDLDSAGAEDPGPKAKLQRSGGTMTKYLERDGKPGAMSIALAKAARW